MNIIDSRDLPNSWRIVDDDIGNFRTRGLPFRYSYVGAFPQSLAEYFVRVYTNKGDTILDPFSGRGSVAMQALFHGRNMVCNDLSPYSNTLCHSVLWTPDMRDVVSYVDTLEDIVSDMDGVSKYEGKGQEDDVAKLYDADTFTQLIKLRQTLNSDKFLLGEGTGQYKKEYEHEIVMFVRAVTTQLMLGGSLGFNGVKTKGTDNTTVKGLLKYYDKFDERSQKVNVFSNIRRYLYKMRLEDAGYREKACKLSRKLISCDAKDIKLPSKSVDGVITSPPYFHVLCYGQSNWARLWMLNGVGDPLVKPQISVSGGGIVTTVVSSEVHGKMYDKITKSTMSTSDNVSQYSSFTSQYLKELYRVLKDDTFAIIIVGDYGSKRKIEAWRLVVDRAKIIGFKPEIIIKDELNVTAKSSSHLNINEGGGKNDYDLCCVLYKGEYKMKNKAEDIDFRWSHDFMDKRQLTLEGAWRQ